ncbi:MAG TPA: hypothetical protein VHP37_18605 [Burkholderiales bacterium]|nr:hypothetical protein [Burkholderiales bacterium]
MKHALIIASMTITTFGLIVDLAGLPGPLQNRLLHLTAPSQPNDVLAWIAYVIAAVLFAIAIAAMSRERDGTYPRK